MKGVHKQLQKKENEGKIEDGSGKRLLGEGAKKKKPKNLLASMMKLLLPLLHVQITPCGRLAVPLEQAFLAESPDASEEAQARLS